MPLEPSPSRIIGDFHCPCATGPSDLVPDMNSSIGELLISVGFAKSVDGARVADEVFPLRRVNSFTLENIVGAL